MTGLRPPLSGPWALLFFLAIMGWNFASQTPVKGQLNKPGTSLRPGPLESLTVDALIDRLREESEPLTGAHTTAWSNGFLPIDEKPTLRDANTRSARPRTSPVMKEIVRRGILSLPNLLEHLEDNRPTQLVFKGNNLGSPLILSNEYDARFSDPARRPKGTVNSFFQPGAIEGAKGIDTVNDSEVRYTVKVGDLCFVALGQIVNRNLKAVRNQPALITVINSPVHVSALARACREDWAGLTAEQHIQSLVRDCNSHYPGNIHTALNRLLFYYPAEGEKTLLKLLNRPFYDSNTIQEFINNELNTLSSLNDKQKEKLHTQESYSNTLENFQKQFNYMVPMSVPFDVDQFGTLLKMNIYDSKTVKPVIVKKIICDPVPPNYRDLMNDFQKTQGEASLAAVPFWLYHRYHVAPADEDIQFLAKTYKADQILKKAFPDFNIYNPYFINLVTVEDQNELLENLWTFSTPRLDKALYQIFLNASTAKNLLLKPNPEKHQLARTCIARLAGKAYDQEFRAYLEKQIKDIKDNYSDQYRRIEKQEFELLEKLRK